MATDRLLRPKLLLAQTVRFRIPVNRSGFADAFLVGGAVLITLGVTANAILPWWSGIALIIGLVVYTLFEKLDAINTNIARSNELKRRELDLRN